MTHPFGWLSLLPPVAAIALAIATRRVVTSLLAGILVGALILNHGNPLTAIADALELHLWTTAIEPANLRLFTFTVLMGAIVGVLSESGGMRGLIHLVTPWAKNRRRGQLATWFAGLLIFFDDYANTILLGNTLRPLCDKLRISREKLAFLVDSTAAPVAGIAPLATWVAYEIRLIDDGIGDLAIPAGAEAPGAFTLFLYSMPYRFYAIWMLCFVPLVAILLRDFGPMRRAEELAIDGKNSPGKLPDRIIDAPDVDKDRWYNAVLPIVVTLLVATWLLYATGVDGWQREHGDAPAQWTDILGKSDSPKALAYAALCGLALAAVMVRLQGILSWRAIGAACDHGIRAVLPALAILVCAMTLSQMTKGNPAEDETAFEQQQTRLYTGYYLSSVLLGNAGDTAGDSERDLDTSRRDLLRWSLPTIVFLLAAFVAFCTGTSFGTMGILMPMTISLAYNVLSGDGIVADSHPILAGTIGSVLAGAIFGDHCSPISDTTILSSQACGCNHVDHVITQMPYAVLVAAVSILCGTLPLGWGVSVWLLLPLQVVALGIVVAVVGKKVEQFNE